MLDFECFAAVAEPVEAWMLKDWKIERLHSLIANKPITINYLLNSCPILSRLVSKYFLLCEFGSTTIGIFSTISNP